MENLEQKFAHIKGWGIDSDPENEPTHPMKNYTGDDHDRLNYERASQQPVNQEILHSNERPGITTVFGTSTPPTGISGVIRRYAFNHSENRYRHWLPLLIADRVNVAEGVFDDIRKGIFPNFWAERGWKSEWKHKPVRLVGKIAIRLAIIVGVVSLLTRSKKNT